MRKGLLGLVAGMFLLVGCQEETTEIVKSPYQDVAVDMSDFYVHTDANAEEAGRVAKGQKSCYSMVNLNRRLEENPNLYQTMYNIEKQTRQFAAFHKSDDANMKKGGGKPGTGGGGGGDTGGGDNLGQINIPVYVHVIYNTSQQNISDQQINSQIAVLNADFNKTNSDINQVPSEFAGVAADVEISFTLAGVTRKASSRTSWGTNDAMKFSSQGGVDPITPATALNIWVCEIGGGILGYAQFPGGSASTDGVVVGPQYFGTTGFVSAPFNEGRTATHEVGHYLNLRHIWGDGRCRQDDFVSDTPSSDGPNYGCPSYPTVNCRSNDMTMNYMDYVNDACMYMFSEGQKTRMRAVFAAGGPRSGFVQ